MLAAAVCAACATGSAPARPAASPEVPVTASSAPSATPPAGSSAPATGTGTVTPSVTRYDLGALVPLWPFTTAAQVGTWQAAYRAGGSQPWHLDLAQTALAFTRDHLGYTDIDRVTSQSVRGGDARVGVGWSDPESAQHTVAVLHLARFGAGEDAPWVVAGSYDTVLTLETPRYGAVVTSPVAVGGRITGVDESLRAVLLGPTSSTPLAITAGLGAGGVSTPWSTTLRFTAPAGTVLTLAVSTGGHLKAVEAFALTAVRAG